MSNIKLTRYVGFSLSIVYAIFYAIRAIRRTLLGKVWIQQSTKKNAYNLKNSSLKGLVMQLISAERKMAVMDIYHGRRL
ncbi:hypothetical protein HMPREF3212_02455 [Citrobacter freundii]|nr:hypothetical protein HMPREF3212_02455 [Citrobacter freundii]